MSNLLRSLIVRVGADVGDFQKSMKYLSKDLKKAGKELKSTGETLTKGLTVPIVGAATALTGLAVNAGQQADELITMSNKTGIATQALQEMEYAARFIDVELDTMTGSMQKLTKSMDGARDGTGAQAEAFKTLGIEVTNSDGSLRNAKQVWLEAIDALGNVANETDRDALAMQLFGKSAAELNPLIKAGSDELQKLSLEAHEVGAVMSDENVNALGKFDDSLQKAQAALKGASNEIAASFAPLLTDLVPLITQEVVPAIRGFAEWLSGMIEKYKSLSPEMQTFIKVLGVIVVSIGPVLTTLGSMAMSLSALITTYGTVSAAIAGAGGFTAALGAIGTAVTGPVGIAIAAIAGIVAIGVTLYKNWDTIKEKAVELWNKVQEVFGKIRTFVTDTWEAISGGPEWSSPSGNYSTGSMNLGWGGGGVTVNNNLTLDGQTIGTSTSKVLYDRGTTRSRAMGVPAQ